MYATLIAWEPAASVDVVKAALPLVKATVDNTVVPSLKVADPAGIPVVEDFTVAVNVTDPPSTDGFTEERTAVEVAALLVTKFSTADVLPLKLASPL